MLRSLFSPRRFRSRYAPWCLGVLVVFAVQASLAELNGPTSEDRRITISVVNLLRMEQLTRQPLDDKISQRTVKGFLKMLDPMKVYFYQGDVDGFMSYEKDLDEKLKAGDTQFSYTVFNTLLERIDERVRIVDELLDSKMEFTADEEMVIDPDTAVFPKDAAEARDVWRKRIKYDLLQLKADKATKEESGKSANEQDPKDRLRRRYHSFAKRMHQTDHQELLEMYLTSLTTSYDPHSTYMAPKSLENFDIVMRLNLEGIGASLQFDDGYTVVKEVIGGGAADKDGRLKAEDRIVGVGQGEDGQLVDTMDMKLSDVVDMIRGTRGTVVRLEVIPAGKQDRQIYNIVRDKIELTDSEARAKIIERDRNGQKYRIGVIDLPSFYMDMEGARRGNPEFKSTSRDMTRLLRDFRSKGVDAVVLDLSRNGGGALTEAISVTGLFIDEGPIVQVKDKNGQVQAYDDPERGTEWDGPLVVLTSKLSASASEIFAGAIQDYQRGIIVGDSTTHGKGTVQSLLDLGKQLFRVAMTPKLGALKITMQQFYRPDGASTQNRGVVSDVVIPSMTDVLKGIGEADLDYALAFDRVEPATHERKGMVDARIVEQLKVASAKRRESSDGFKKLARTIERYEQQKSRKAITLNEEKFMAERAEVNAEREEEKELDDSSHSRRVFFDDKSFYNQEVLEITLDYLRLAKLATAGQLAR
ncbi:MAG TPA: carboxy terminal-processing peptidase [Pirellulales bacterium]|jgi:carboxyl-terminal processing protease|nr:carboxy terminal-processing peptidase [Pirellulales bacterium]